MATEVFTTEIITLQDGTEVELRPLPISRLRKFMRIWSDHIDSITKELESPENTDNPLTNLDLSDRQYTAFIKMCSLSLGPQIKGERTEAKFLDYLEDILDEPTVMKILEATGNFKTNVGDESPNPTPPETVEAGTN